MAQGSQGALKHNASIIDYPEHYGIPWAMRKGPNGKYAWRYPQGQVSCVLRAGIPMDALQEGALENRQSQEWAHPIAPYPATHIQSDLPKSATSKWQTVK